MGSLEGTGEGASCPRSAVARQTITASVFISADSDLHGCRESSDGKPCSSETRVTGNHEMPAAQRPPLLLERSRIRWEDSRGTPDKRNERRRASASSRWPSHAAHDRPGSLQNAAVHART